MTTPPVATIVAARRLELSRVYTPLGIRFHDSALDQPVADGLRVAAVHVSGLYPPVPARRSSTGVYGFHELPLLRDVEYPRGEIDAASLVPRHAFAIVVEDTLGRFVRMVFVVKLPLPYRGVFLSEAEGSPLRASGRVYLFSAPTRSIPSGCAAVRAELWNVGTPESGPAAFTAVTVDVEGRRYRGIADEGGRILVVFPYPTLEHLRRGSPPGLGQSAVGETTWDVTVRVAEPPRERPPLAGLGSLPEMWRRTPSLKSILTTPDALVWPSESGAGAPSITASIRYREELLIRTEGSSALRSRLLIRGTSP